MEKYWKLVYFIGENYRVDLAKDLLVENVVSPFILNRKDFSYNVFGDIKYMFVMRIKNARWKYLKT